MAAIVVFEILAVLLTSQRQTTDMSFSVESITIRKINYIIMLTEINGI